MMLLFLDDYPHWSRDSGAVARSQKPMLCFYLD
jgi:hypothetical protein